MLTIITVGYQEAANLPKLYASLKWLQENKIPNRKIYIDQESTDDSLKIAESLGAEVFRRTNKGYADPDKKWAVETLTNQGDWILIADADFEFPREFWIESKAAIDSGKWEAISILRNVYFMGEPGISVRETVFFEKGAVTLTDNIHKYYEVITNKIYKMKSLSICDDLKEHGKSVSVWLKRIDKYTDIEAIGAKRHSRLELASKLVFSPILWFFGYGLFHKQFLGGVPGMINCFINAFYRISLYSKIYELQYGHNESNARS